MDCSQTSFVPGRLISDNIIMSHELVKWYNRKSISPRCMLKIDMQKAYDSVEWPYTDQILKLLGFPEIFTKWIMECMTTVTYSVVINGKHTPHFPAKKGLRQGDLISPFLFVLAMEYLSRLLKSLQHMKTFKFHPRCAKVKLVHLSFVDNLLLFCRGDVASVTALHTQFRIFSAASYLIANPQKSSVYFEGVSLSVQQQIMEMLGYEQGVLPFRYLGVPLSTKGSFGYGSELCRY